MNGIGMLTNKDVLKAEDVTMKGVSTMRMNLYTNVIETAIGSEIRMFASFGYDLFIGKSNYPKEYDALCTIFNKFLIEYLNKYYADEIKNTSKKIASMKKKKVKLQKSMARNDKKI